MTFIESVARDFISKVTEGWYAEHDLPPMAKRTTEVEDRVKIRLRSLIKRERTRKKLTTIDLIAAAKAHEKYMQRRREVSKFIRSGIERSPFPSRSIADAFLPVTNPLDIESILPSSKP